MMISQRLRQPTRVLVCVAVICVFWACAAYAGSAPAASAFQLMPTYGVSLVPVEFTSGQLTYTVSLASDAYVLYQGTQYPIAMIWGFYAVNATGLAANDLIATGNDISEWAWGQKPTNGSVLSVGGWTNQSKNEAILLPASGSASKDFTFTSFSFSGSAPVLGLHVSVAVPDGKPSPFGGGVTGDISPTSVPEPASLSILGLGLVGLVRRRNK